MWLSREGGLRRGGNADASFAERWECAGSSVQERSVERVERSEGTGRRGRVKRTKRGVRQNRRERGSAKGARSQRPSSPSPTSHPAAPRTRPHAPARVPSGSRSLAPPARTHPAITLPVRSLPPPGPHDALVSLSPSCPPASRAGARLCEKHHTWAGMKHDQILGACEGANRSLRWYARAWEPADSVRTGESD